MRIAHQRSNVDILLPKLVCSTLSNCHGMDLSSTCSYMYRCMAESCFYSLVHTARAINKLLKVANPSVTARLVSIIMTGLNASCFPVQRKP